MINFKVCAVLPAGGTGERSSLDIPKQFYPIHGKPLICYTIEEFERITWIQKIAVVVPLSHMERMHNIVARFCYTKILITTGGTSRHRSIAAGVKILQESDPEVVVIHDAVRPFVPFEILKETVLAAQTYGAAGAVRPLVSTVVAKDENGLLSDTLDRMKYLASEMPQAFQFKIISKAYEQCNEYDFEFGTECLHLAHKYCSVKAKLLSGPPELWKVTYKKDIYAVERTISEIDDSKCFLSINGELDSTILTCLMENLGNFQLISSMDKIPLLSFTVLLHVQNFASFEKWCMRCLKILSRQTIIHVLKIDLNLSFELVMSVLKKFSTEAQNTGKIFHFIWMSEKDWSAETFHKLSSLIHNLKSSFPVSSGQLLSI